jgi:hypothetical protein
MFLFQCDIPDKCCGKEDMDSLVPPGCPKEIQVSGTHSSASDKLRKYSFIYGIYNENCIKKLLVAFLDAVAL